MIVLSLTNCSNALRGDLTRWLFEVDTNIYVGNQSARIRDKIWERVTKYTKSGRAVMVYPANNEQGFDFRVLGTTWMPVDFDGLKLMLRPIPGAVLSNTKELKPGDSNAEKRLAAKRFSSSKRNQQSLPDTYIVLDIETTGLSADLDEIIEIGAIKVSEKVSTDTFQAIIRTMTEIPPEIEKLTGITSEVVSKEGQEIAEVIQSLREFAGKLPIISHNVAFDMGFLRKAYEKCGYAMPTNSCVDTLRLARKLINTT